jgi:radical SAM-linked protein
MSWWLVSFARGGPARYISHLDTMRVVQRTFARAGIELALSQGMRPKPRLSLPLPLPTGAAGLDELAVVEVAEETAAELLGAHLRALRAAAADGLTIERLVVTEERPRPQATAAAYECRLGAPCAAVDEALVGFVAEPHVRVLRESPKGRRTIELKEYVCELAASPCDAGTKLAFTLRYGPGGSARVDEVVAALAARLGIEPVVLDLTRLRVTWKGLPPRSSAVADEIAPGGSVRGQRR